MKILLLDIETAPNVAHVWDLWNQNIGLNQLMEAGYMLCWSAKWVGEKGIYYADVRGVQRTACLREIHGLLEQADAVVTWNGSRFDIPTLNREFIQAGLKPPAPYLQIDLLKVAKERFKFTSNKLEFVVQALKCGKKVKHEGHDLWVKCLAGERTAWNRMRKYNINDTVILEGLYNKMLPWITDHPHTGMFNERPNGCPNCGGSKLQSRGYAYTKLRKYVRWQCQSCGTWSRSIRGVGGGNLRGVAG